MKEKREALDYSIKLLTFRSRSVNELESRLRKRGFSEKVLTETISELKTQGYLDDLVFTKMWISERFRLKNIGRNRVRQELLMKGIKKEIVEAELLNYSDQDEEERALTIARKKFMQNNNHDPIKGRERLYRFLIYKGFDVSTSAEVSRRIFELEGGNFDRGDY